MFPPATPTGWRRSSTPARASPTASTAWSPRCCRSQTGCRFNGRMLLGRRGWVEATAREEVQKFRSAETDEFQDLHLLLEENLNRILLEIQGERESVVVMLPQVRAIAQIQTVDADVRGDSPPHAQHPGVFAGMRFGRVDEFARDAVDPPAVAGLP